MFALEDSSLEESCGGLPPVEDGDRKISLIMELSTQVSLQNERITQLEEVLEEKERKIQQLEAEREAHCFPEVKDSPECLEETPVFSNNNVSPVVYDVTEKDLLEVRLNLLTETERDRQLLKGRKRSQIKA